MIGDDDVEFVPILVEKVQGKVAIPCEFDMVTGEGEDGAEGRASAELVIDDENIYGTGGWWIWNQSLVVGARGVPEGPKARFISSLGQRPR